MKPIRSFSGSLATTGAIVVMLSFLASIVPVSTAAESGGEKPVVVSENVAEMAIEGLEVEITHVRNDKGKVLVLVFDDRNAFAAYDFEKAVGFAEFAAGAGVLYAQFPELDAGRYAVTFFHDENGDYDLNMDGAYPLEGYGISGAKNAYDEPTFDHAAFDGNTVSVRTYYLRQSGR